MQGKRDEFGDFFPSSSPPPAPGSGGSPRTDVGEGVQKERGAGKSCALGRALFKALRSLPNNFTCSPLATATCAALEIISKIPSQVLKTTLLVVQGIMGRADSVSADMRCLQRYLVCVIFSLL